MDRGGHHAVRTRLTRSRSSTGGGKTLLPGLIDSHTHAQLPSLEHALLFGVTTELDMFSCPEWMDGQRRDAADRNDLADVRSASIGATVLGGHPSMMIGTYFAEQYPVVASLQDASAFVGARVAEGADYIKLLIDDGTALGHDSPHPRRGRGAGHRKRGT